MDLSSTEEQVQLRDSVRRLLDKVSGPEAVRAAEDAGHDPSIISGLAEIGAFSMGLPESLGGFDASLSDLAVVATEAGSHLAMAPVVEALVAGRVLASASRSADLGDWIESVASGGRLVTFAPRPTLCGIADLVPGGAVADAVVALDGVELVLVAPSEGATTRVPNTAGTAIGDVDLARLAERVVLASGDAATRPNFRAATPTSFPTSTPTSFPTRWGCVPRASLAERISAGQSPFVGPVSRKNRG